jgi:hypothetical protein
MADKGPAMRVAVIGAGVSNTTTMHHVGMF